MSQEVIDRATQLVNAFDARVQAASADSWGNAAPCDGWTARDVVVHVGNNLGRLGAGLAGQEASEIAPDADIVAAWDAAKTSFLSGISTADLSTPLPGPFDAGRAADRSPRVHRRARAHLGSRPRRRR
jgi:Mycothiol maleylpyruvate isomerase N-terminal domain